MPAVRRKWFWVAAAAGILSFCAMFAAKHCASQCGIITALAMQAIHDGAPVNTLESSKIASSKYAEYATILDIIGVVFGALLLTTWAISYFRGEPTYHLALLAAVILLSFFFFIMV